MTEAIEKYLLSRLRRGCQPTTLEFYQDRMRQFTEYLTAQGIAHIGDVTLPLLQDFVDYQQARTKIRQKGRLSPVTINKTLKNLRQFFTWAKREALIDVNPTDRLDMPKHGKRLPKALKPFQVMRLLQTPMDEREKAIIFLLLDSGLRLSEMTNLDLTDVDLVGTTVLVRAGKGDKDRLCVFSLRTADVLKEWLKVRKAPEAVTTFFVDYKQQRLRPQAAYRLIKHIGKRAQLDTMHPHTLRHSMATMYLDNGGAIQDLSALLGHTTLAMTMKYVSISTASLHRKHERFSPVERMYQAPTPEMLIKQ
jgi:site-specific recombinase XerD